MMAVNRAIEYISHELGLQLKRAGRESFTCTPSKVFKLLVASMTVVGTTCLSPQLVTAQNNSTSNGVGNFLDYPYGTRIYENGRISNPSGGSMYPSTTINNGNGVTTYYYRNGTRVMIKKNQVSPSGTILRSGSFNGGLPTKTNRINTLPTPSGLNRNRR
jgi:hypothetical protein